MRITQSDFWLSQETSTRSARIIPPLQFARHCSPRSLPKKLLAESKSLNEREMQTLSVTLRKLVKKGTPRMLVRTQGVLPKSKRDWLLFGFCCVAASIALFVAFEVRAIHTLSLFRLLATGWIGTLIAMVRIVMSIHFAVEVFRPMEPRPNADEDAFIKPLRAIVASGSTIIRRNVVVAVGAIGSYTDFDGDLSFRRRGRYRETDSSNNC